MLHCFRNVNVMCDVIVTVGVLQACWVPHCFCDVNVMSLSPWVSPCDVCAAGVLGAALFL